MVASMKKSKETNKKEKVWSFLNSWFAMKRTKVTPVERQLIVRDKVVVKTQKRKKTKAKTRLKTCRYRSRKAKKEEYTRSCVFWCRISHI